MATGCADGPVVLLVPDLRAVEDYTCRVHVDASAVHSVL